MGTAAVAAGAVARSHATPGARKRPTAAVSIGFGLVSIVVGIRVLAAWLLTSSPVACCLLRQLNARTKTQLGVDVREVRFDRTR